MKGRKILTASAVVLVIGMVGSIAGLIKEQWVASRFGIGGEVDIFGVALTIPLFAISLIGSSVTAIVIPAYIKAFRDNKDHELVTEISGMLLPFVIIMTLLACAASWVIMPMLASGFDTAKLEKARALSLALGPLVALQTISALFDGILNARSQYVVSSSSTLLIPIGTIVLLIIMIDASTWLLCAGLYLGILAKISLQVLSAPHVFMPMLLKPHYLNNSKWKKHHALNREFMALMFSSVILGIMPVIGQYYAASLPAGTVASLGYANKLIGVGMVLLTGVINAVVFPLIAQRNAEDRNEAIRFAMRLIGFTIVAGLLLVATMASFVEMIVRLIFERGEFTAKATQEVSHILFYMLPHIPFYIAGLLLARLVVTLGMSRIFVIGNVISILIYWLICEGLVVQIGIAGVGVALTAVYMVSALYLYVAIRRSVR